MAHASGLQEQDAPVVVWFRQDLRCADNPALAAAAASGRPVIALYVLDDATPGHWRIGGAGRWWLGEGLKSLAADLAALGGALTLRHGAAAEVVPAFCQEARAAEIVWNRCYEPFAIARDAGLKTALGALGVKARSFNAGLLVEPWEVATGAGGSFKVFSPFWRACLARGVDDGLAPTPARLPAPATPPPSDALSDWALAPSAPDWAGGLRASWRPGAAGAQALLQAFLDAALTAYAEDRNRPDRATTSRLSPHLHWGEISPRQVWRAAAAAEARDRRAAKGAEKFRSELGWREFAHHLLYHSPTLPERNFKDSFDAFPWRQDDRGLRAWRRGRTGYPIVDAGMRELWATGWMHNRVRMITASFLIKHLLIDWRAGQDWFWDTLVDADLANNAASWQWVAGSGADAAPYFRIFNPIAQGETFDPGGGYVRRWLPELAALPDTVLHRPWEAGPLVLREAGVGLGETYPHPIVDHAAARARALTAFASLKAAA